MFLKSIEIRGFKSFADKTELNFKKGITSVVGPNGSGKSNISDAVRWVLGEQSIKHLRGAKMEDVIFIGTEFRKPVGLAQVSLILNNEEGELKVDYSEVKVTRRLYRSGESEYLINNTKCRLKDIQELFMDTGIGKEGYSIIGQGKIDAILSGRPEERRALLEEAAGIVKFKNRKEEAEKKLNITNENLTRITDILSTYEERLEPLRLDMEKAKEFLSLSEELKEKDLGLIIHNIDQIQKKVFTFKNEKESKEESLGEFIKNKNYLKSQLEKYTLLLEEHEEKNKRSLQEYYDYKEKINNTEMELKVISEKIKNAELLIKRYEEDIAKLQRELQNLLINRNDTEKEIEFLREKQLKLKNGLSIYEKELSKFEGYFKESNMELDNLKEKLKLVIEDELKSEKEKENLNREIKVLLDKIEEINIVTENTSNLIKINANTRKKLEEQCKDIEEKVKTYEESIKENTKEISIFRSKLSNIKNQHKSKNIEFNKLEANLNILSNLEKQYEGYTKAVKKLMEHIENGFVKKVTDAFVLGETINVPKGFETAIEIALGGSISNIITDTEEEAKILISYLKEKSLGRATFLPLNIVKGRHINTKLDFSNIKGFLGRASDILSYDNKFKNAIEFVLGNVILAEDMESALHIAKLTSYSNRIVTLSGEVINVGGSLTGGSTYSKSSNIISRKREIDELSRRIEELKDEIKSTTIKIEEYNNRISELDEYNLNLRDTIHGENIDIIKLKERINSLLEEENKGNNTFKKLQNDVKNYASKINIYKNNLNFIEQSTSSLSINKKTLEDNIRDLEDKLVSSNKELNYIKEEAIEKKIALAALNENLSNKEVKLEELKVEFTEKDHMIGKYSSLRNEENKNLTEYNKLISFNKMELLSLRENIKLFDEKFKEENIDRLKLKDKINEFSGKIENLSIEEESINKELNKVIMNLTRFETEYNSILERLNEEYNITYAEAIDYKNSNLDIYNTKKEIENLKAKINSLGMVNVGAIQEYKEVKEKYTFMSTQKEDLEESKKEILTVINEMTLKMKEVFKDNFEKLNEYFHETFTELFKGGSASLILSQGDELSGKIDINVQPPGKKLQNINLMSGGEKVLSAIALLFSILKMKPTPFCILDEIEAALDDANVLRYAEFLKKFSDRIQFIVITHRKGTMGVSDALYGITMEEKGISKVVSVDLNKNINN
ncbi:chromosome segregation protein SMC [Hathewaya massiliensis]|uniref:chromosome segregation protein SMC n=1 Tax=Hathewaya massiliensis TaxID=1964382 RepID=UPI001158E8DC|nr:chromosome segregation protein SMC [Hathewaya massiliensis]